MRRTAITILAAAAMVAIVVPANAADIYMSGSDTGTATSFAAGTDWTGGATPAAGNNYFTGAYTLQGSKTLSQKFAGDTLTIGDGGKLTLYAVPYAGYSGGTIVPKLILNNCTIVNGSTSGVSEIRASDVHTSSNTPANQLANQITMAGDLVLDSSAGGSIMVAAQLVGTGGVTIKGNVTYSYSALDGWWHMNSYTGNTVITSGGTLTLSYCYMPNGAGKGNVIVNTGGAFNLMRTQSINGLSGGGAVTTQGGYTVTLGNGNADGNFSGSISGGSIIAKTGAGTQIFRGANLYTGGTQVNAGVLLVNNTTGSGTGTGAVAVNNGGTLGGTGFIGGAVTVAAGGKLSPGESAGNLTINNSLNISGALSGAAGSMLFDLGDTVTLSGANVLTIGSGLLNWDDFVFTGTAANGTYTLFDTSAAISGTLGTTRSGKIGSYDATLSLGESGQDILLTVVPEPATMSLLALGALAALLKRRRVA